jgi:hypothetical protein
VQISQELCKSNAELCNLVAKWTYVNGQLFFTVHQNGRNELAHTVDETLYFKPHQKYLKMFIFQDYS